MPTNLQSRSMVRPLELLSPSLSSASEVEALKRELSNVRSCYEVARGDVSRLQVELNHKAAECKALASECERTKRESDQQIKQLEDALKDVQKRMFDSEGKVKQMQTHFLALKDHLTSEAALGSSKVAEELKDQLKDMKAKYEGASAEVGKLRNQLKQNELLVEEFRRDETRLVEENKKLQKELGTLKSEREKRERRASEAEGQLKETAAKFADQYEKMRSSLSSEVDEKAWKLAEMEKEREKLLAETQRLRAELESQRVQLSQYVRPEEHKLMKSRYEQRSRELERAQAGLKQANQALQKELDRAQAASSQLKQQAETLRSEMDNQFVPLRVSEEMKRANDVMVGELNRKLTEITEKYHKCKGEAEKLLAEKVSLRDMVGHLQATYVPPEKHEKETGALKSTVADLKRQLAELGQKYEEEQAKAADLVSKNEALQVVLKEQYVPAETHEETKTALNSTLEKTGQELSDLKVKMEGVKQEFLKVNEENEALKRKLRVLESQIKGDYISTRDHNSQVAALNQRLQELQENSSEMLAKYQQKQEEVAQLHAEIEAQKQELDMIQECIKSKYAPLASLQERERSFEATVKELRSQLSEQGEQLAGKEEEIKKGRQENEKLKAALVAVQKDLEQNYILAEKSREMERMFASKMEELNKQLTELREESARQRSEALEAQSQCVPVEQVEAVKRQLHSAIEELKGELSSQGARHQQECQKAEELRQELAHLRGTSVPLAEHARIKEGLERDVASMKSTLREKEEESHAKGKEISELQSEIQSTKQALREMESREEAERLEHKMVTLKLEGQLSSMVERLAEQSAKSEGLCEKAVQVKMEELLPEDEKEPLQQPRGFSIEQEIKDQKERCDKSLSTIVELQKRIQESAKQVEAKDNKVSRVGVGGRTAVLAQWSRQRPLRSLS